MNFTTNHSAKPIAQSIVECLTFWGPLTPTHIVQKLAMRGEVLSLGQVTNACLQAANDKKIQFGLSLTDDIHTLPQNRLFKL